MNKQDMPQDFRPATPAKDLHFMRNDISLLDLIPDNEQGKAIIAAINAADKYADEYNDDIMPITTGLSKPAKIVCERLFEGFKKGLDAYRVTCWGRSHDNGGGGQEKNSERPTYAEVEQIIKERGYHFTALDFFTEMNSTGWRTAHGNDINKINVHSALLQFERKYLRFA